MDYLPWRFFLYFQLVFLLSVHIRYLHILILVRYAGVFLLKVSLISVRGNRRHSFIISTGRVRRGRGPTRSTRNHSSCQEGHRLLGMRKFRRPALGRSLRKAAQRTSSRIQSRS